MQHVTDLRQAARASGIGPPLVQRSTLPAYCAPLRFAFSATSALSLVRATRRDDARRRTRMVRISLQGSTGASALSRPGKADHNAFGWRGP
jgi:hypothetical protein